MPLFGQSMAGLGPIMAEDPDGDYCRHLAGFHQATARRRVRNLLRVLTLSLHVAIGVIAIACVDGMLATFFDLATGIEP